MEISGLLAREFKISVIQKCTKIWRVMDEQSETETIKLKKISVELKIAVEG